MPAGASICAILTLNGESHSLIAIRADPVDGLSLFVKESKDLKNVSEFKTIHKSLDPLKLQNDT